MIRAAAAAAPLAVLAACASEERVVRYNPFFADVPGAVHNTPPVRPAEPGTESPPDPSSDIATSANAPAPAAEEPSDEFVITRPDGSRVLVRTTIRHVMVHLVRTLDNGEDDLLYEQILSEETKQRLRDQGREPRAYVDQLRAHRAEIGELFARMPLAENSPNARMSRVGPHHMVLEVAGPSARGLKVTRLWVTLERDGWRLLWIA